MELRKIMSGKVVSKSSILGVLVSVSVLILYNYSLSLPKQIPVITTSYSEDIDNFVNSDLAKSWKEELSNGNLIKDSSYNPIPPEQIRNRKVITKVLSEDSDYMYTRRYDSNYKELPRVISFIDLKNGHNYGFYNNTYSGIDCLGVGFNQTFQGEKPVSKEQCESAIKEMNTDLALKQKIYYDSFIKYNKKVITERNKIKEEVKKRGLIEKWAYTDTLNDSCMKTQEYSDIESTQKGVFFDSKAECESNHLKQEKLYNHSNSIKNDLSKVLIFIFFSSFILFLPLFSFIIKNVLRLVNYMWISFISNTFEAINSSEKKIKIDANLNIKKKDND